MSSTEYAPARTALLAVDIQESFRHRPYWSDDDVPEFLEAAQRLIVACEATAIPVVQIFHVEEQGAFSPASGHVRTMVGLAIEPGVAIHKRHFNAFVETELGPWLSARGITRLIVCGIRTEQCCETTTRHAAEHGFEVDFVSDATLTFAMTHPLTGRSYSAAEIKARTELVLAGRFARIRRAGEVCEELMAER
ncbi:MAG TPA: isochorismatase family protein [Candidatus Dormibacteraeota bacterium]|nr:isochorismatase family protein [Candidatus Dormibacteraeota bacterium]